MRPDLTQALLKEVLHYDPETGVFTWLQKVSERVVIGHRAGQLKPSGYREVGVLGARYMEHRLVVLYVTGSWPNQEVDHVNGIRNDNRYSNLRICTHAENHQNRGKPSHGRSPSQGVTWHKLRQNWRAAIVVGGKQKHLGLFTDQQEAHQAYLAAKEHLHTFQPTPRDLCTSSTS